MIAVAIVGSAALTAGVGAISSAAASSKQAKAASNALNLQKSMFDTAKAGLDPYNTFGQSVLPQLQGLLGIGPKGGAGMQSTLEQLPGYQFTLGQGLKSTQNSYAARGLGTSGAALKGAASYATGLANSQYNTYFNNLLSGAQLGEGAAAAVGGVASNFAGPIGNSATNIGNAQANGILGVGNSISGGINNAVGGLIFNSLMGGGGSSAVSGSIANANPMPF